MTQHFMHQAGIKFTCVSVGFDRIIQTIWWQLYKMYLSSYGTEAGYHHDIIAFSCTHVGTNHIPQTI